MKLTRQALAELIDQLQRDQLQVAEEFLSYDGYSDRLSTEICHLGQAIESLNALRELRRKDAFQRDCLVWSAADIPVFTVTG